MERPEPSSKVRIAVRVRPAPPDSTGAECITCLDDGRTLNLNAGSGSSVRPRSFGFDTVLGGDTTQEEFFHGCGVTGMLDAVLDGYTATVFAYGQTGSGKTYTTAGPAEATAGPGGALQADAGMMQRAVQYLYAGMAARPGYKYTVRATYLEIYNEQIIDLINPGGPLSVRGSHNASAANPNPNPNPNPKPEPQP